MKKLFAILSIGVLAACGSPQNEEETVTVIEADAPVETMSLNETTWTFTMDEKDMIESIDADGNYIVNAGDEHFDHGTYVMIDGKQCFTSAMNDDGQECWTNPPAVDVGETVEIMNEAGEQLTVTRIEYEPLTM